MYKQTIFPLVEHVSFMLCTCLNNKHVDKLQKIQNRCLMRPFQEAIHFFIEKGSELLKYVTVGVETCCRQIEAIGAVLSGDIF